MKHSPRAQQNISAERLAGRFLLTAGLGGMGGAQPLAATMNGAACLVVEVDRDRIEKRLRHTLSGYDDRRFRRSALLIRGCKMEKNCHSLSDFSAMLRRSFQKSPPENFSRTSSPIRHPHTIHSTAMFLQVFHTSKALELRKKNPKKYIALAQASIGEHVRAMLTLLKKRRRRLRLRKQHPGRSVGKRSEKGFRHSRLRAGIYSAAFLRRQRPVPVGCTVGRSRRYLSNRPCRDRDFPAKQAALQLDREGSKANCVSGIARPNLLARLRRTRRDGKNFQRPRCARRSQRADRHRTRPSRLRIRRFTEPRNGKHERRQRCDRGLADPQRSIKCCRAAQAG